MITNTSYFLLRSHSRDGSVSWPTANRLQETVTVSKPLARALWSRAGEGTFSSDRLPNASEYSYVCFWSRVFQAVASFVVQIFCRKQYIYSSSVRLAVLNCLHGHGFSEIWIKFTPELRSEFESGILFSVAFWRGLGLLTFWFCLVTIMEGTLFRKLV